MDYECCERCNVLQQEIDELKSSLPAQAVLPRNSKPGSKYFSFFFQ